MKKQEKEKLVKSVKKSVSFFSRIPALGIVGFVEPGSFKLADSKKYNHRKAA